VAVTEFGRTKEFIGDGIVQLKFDDLRAALMGANYPYSPNAVSFDEIAGHEETGLGATGGILLSGKTTRKNGDYYELDLGTGIIWRDVTADISGVVIFRGGAGNGYTNPLLWWLPTNTGSGIRTLVRSDYGLIFNAPLMRW